MNKKIQQAKKILRSGGTVVINEPCDCGDKIRHNNGGNYHEIIRLKTRLGHVWVQYDNTCELTQPEEWQQTDETIIHKFQDWL